MSFLFLGQPWCRSYHRGRSSNSCVALTKIRLWGPSPLMDFFQFASNSFARLLYLDVEIHEIQASLVFSPAIALPPVEELQSKDSPGVSFQFLYLNNEDETGCDEPEVKKQRRIENNQTSSNRLTDKTNAFAKTGTMVVYGELPQKPGRMDVKKIEELKVKQIEPNMKILVQHFLSGFNF